MHAADRTSARFGNERGTVIIQVAVALLALLALSSFVFDYGVMWASRRQAQNSADAGALAGAISLAFDNATDQAGARARAIAMAQANRVWGQSPDVTDGDVTFPPCPPGAPGVPDTCIKVDVFRNQARNNALPTFFARLAGVTDQGVRATATAQVLTGNATECLRPWAVLDRWQEYGPEGPLPLPDSTFDRYSTGTGNAPPPEPDLYLPPWEGGGTGYTLPEDEGRRFAIKMGPTGGSEISSGWFRTIDLARADTTQLGNATVQDNILSCNGLPASFAGPDTVCPDEIPNNWTDTAYWMSQGCYRVQTGATVGSTRNTVEELMARDAGARWEGGGIVNSNRDPALSSPRVVPIGVMDIDWYLQRDPTGNNGVMRMVNIYGFFIEGMGDVDRTTGAISLSPSGQSVIGRIVSLPSMATGGQSTLPQNASFLRTIILVR